MDDYHGAERRRSNDVELALLNQRMDFVERTIAEYISEGKEVQRELKRMLPSILTKGDLDEHTIQDRWLFGVMFATVIGAIVLRILRIT